MDNREGKQVRRAIRRIDAARKAAGTCRHCGGPIPCWSIFGDRAVGKRHTEKSYRKHVIRPNDDN